MINPRQIRTGNFLSDNGRIVEVESYADGKINVYAGYYGDAPHIHGIFCGEIEPIPITPEWLEKCGFRDITDGYRATGAPSACYRIQLPGNGKDFDLYEDSEFGKEFSVRLPHYWSEIKYVHQLQNLYFAMTGEELTMKE